MTFCKLLFHRKCKWRAVGGQKKTNLVNVVCERPLIIYVLKYTFLYQNRLNIDKKTKRITSLFLILDTNLWAVADCCC